MAKRYSKEFKIEAVRLVTDEGYSIADAASSLGVADESIRRWKLELEAAGDAAFAPRESESKVEQENRRLREENRRLRMERDILKKATAFFANDKN